ncbi:MAG: NAD-dependent epimerase/dehydratase family protein [Proteobacteria bacterium]|nr:NAD-dependent epimerase/dehydratase family protein [Pseudomonadota bacterium]
MSLNKTDKIVLLGGAGLVGQNLVVQLKDEGFTNLVIVDKHAPNVAVLRKLHPELTVIEADMAASGSWQDSFAGANSVVMLQAQIGGEDESAFTRNNVESTVQAIAACKKYDVPYIVHISSSVINSQAVDWYTESKKAQEKVIAESGIRHVVLRPTLMFGWFDRKHLGWLSRFMRRVPVFPIPGSGRYLRQPLFVLDFCRIIRACLEQRATGTYNITGRDRVDYIDIIRTVKREAGAGAMIVRIPYSMFWVLLKVYALFDKDPPFTTKQLEALVIPEEFELIPWWDIFNVPATPFPDAVRETFKGRYADVVLEF